LPFNWYDNSGGLANVLLRQGHRLVTCNSVLRLCVNLVLSIDAGAKWVSGAVTNELKHFCKGLCKCIV